MFIVNDGTTNLEDWMIRSYKDFLFFIDSGSESGMTINNEIPHQVRDDKTDGLPRQQVASQ